MNARRMLFLFLVLPLLLAVPAHAQNPDLVLTQAERDSILKDYRSFFPIWGRQAIERGFDLPRAFGISANPIYLTQGITIDNLQLSTNGDPLQPIDGVEFGANKSTVFGATFRADLWVFPFLNVYGLYGPGRANTAVEMTYPVAFETSVDQTSTTYGIGLTGAMGVKRNFLSVDVNWSWTDLENLEDLVQARIIGIRYGRVVKLSEHKRMGFWVGAMNADLELETRGSIRFDEVVPPEFWDDIENIQSSPWYADLTPPQQAVIDRLVQGITNNKETTINYGIDKSLDSPWNMLVGAQLFLGKNWEVRTEAGLIGRWSILVGMGYRFNL